MFDLSALNQYCLCSDEEATSLRVLLIRDQLRRIRISVILNLSPIFFRVAQDASVANHGAQSSLKVVSNFNFQ